jgi:hypothetical protein
MVFMIYSLLIFELLFTSCNSDTLSQLRHNRFRNFDILTLTPQKFSLPQLWHDHSRNWHSHSHNWHAHSHISDMLAHNSEILARNSAWGWMNEMDELFNMAHKQAWRDGVDGRCGWWETGLMRQGWRKTALKRTLGDIAGKPDAKSEGQTECKWIGAQPGSGYVNSWSGTWVEDLTSKEWR